MTDDQYSELLRQHILILDRMTAILANLQSIEAALVVLVFIQFLGFVAVIILAAWSVSRTVRAFSIQGNELAREWRQAQNDIRDGMAVIVRTLRPREDEPY